MNRYRIGLSGELAVKHVLQKQGFLVYKAVHTRFQHEDIFRLFDIIATNHVEIKLIQVKAGGFVDMRTEQAIRDFKVPFGVSKEIWIKNKFSHKKPWTVIECQ